MTGRDLDPLVALCAYCTPEQIAGTDPVSFVDAIEREGWKVIDDDGVQKLSCPEHLVTCSLCGMLVLDANTSECVASSRLSPEYHCSECQCSACSAYDAAEAYGDSIRNGDFRE